jgi:predicted nucleotidyltransferase
MTRDEMALQVEAWDARDAARAALTRPVSNVAETITLGTEPVSGVVKPKASSKGPADE